MIIGNGFDLDLGLKTKYIDFVRSPYFKAMLGGDDSVVSNLVDYGSNKERMQIYPNKLAQFVKKEEESRGWVDLEIDTRDYCIANREIPQAEKDVLV